jgi:hypothetical protein
MARSAVRRKRVRVHPISLALRYLKGQRTLRGAPFYGQPLFASPEEAAARLQQLTGQDLGTDAAVWGAWLRRNRWVYFAGPDDPRLRGSA